MIFVVAVNLADLGETIGQEDEIPLTQPDPPTPERSGTPPPMSREAFEDWSIKNTCHIFLKFVSQVMALGNCSPLWIWIKKGLPFRLL